MTFRPEYTLTIECPPLCACGCDSPTPQRKS